MLIFDSGSGGLSIWQELRTLCPELDTEYLADFAGLPYGTRSDGSITQRMFGLLDERIPVCNPALIVVACNTASTLLLDRLRTRYQLPIVGVVPAIKTAAEAFPGGHIALLATQATVERDYTLRLINDFAKHCSVLCFPQDHLVSAAEGWVRGQDVQDALAQTQNLLAPYDLDAVVLGCTHFPLLKPQLLALDAPWRWVDSGAAIARRVRSLVHQHDLPVGCRGLHRAWYTGERDRAWEQGVQALGMETANTL